MSKIVEHLMDLQYQVADLMAVGDTIAEALRKNREKTLEVAYEISKFIPGVWKVGDEITQLQRVRHKRYKIIRMTCYTEWALRWVQREGDAHGSRERSHIELKISYVGRQIKKDGSLSDFETKMHTYDKYDPPMVSVARLDMVEV